MSLLESIERLIDLYLKLLDEERVASAEKMLLQILRTLPALGKAKKAEPQSPVSS